MDDTSKDEATVIRVRDASKVYRVWDSPVRRLLHILRGEPALDQTLPGHTGESGAQPTSPRGYREFHALRGVSLDVNHGECVGILGYNGSGKSTLLQIIAGTLTPTSGNVDVRGRVAALLELGSGFNPEFTGRENVYLYASILGIERGEMKRRFADVEAFAEIGEFIDEPVRTYSSGMVVRLAFSVLTQIEPDILIIDEALSVGDAYFQHKSMGQIRKFREAGKSILFVSHSTVMVKSLCDRAAILEAGMVVRDGAAEAVCDYYNAMIAAKTKDLEIRQSEGEGGRIRTRSGNKRIVISTFEMVDHGDVPGRAFVPARRAEPHRRIPYPRSAGKLGVRDEQLPPRARLRPIRASRPRRVRVRGQTGARPRSLLRDCRHPSADNHTVENYDWVDNLIAFEVVTGSGIRAEGPAYLPVSGRIMREDPRRNRNYRLGTVIDFGVHGNAGRYRMGGWSHPEENFTWTEGDRAVLVFKIEPFAGSQLVLSMRVGGFIAGPAARQRLIVRIGGAVVGEFDCGVGEREIEVSAASSSVDADGFLEIEFEASDATAPASTSQSADTRKLGMRIHQAVLRATTA